MARGLHGVNPPTSPAADARNAEHAGEHQHRHRTGAACGQRASSSTPTPRNPNSAPLNSTAPMCTARICG
jgi:hypothetical protein